MFFFVSKNTAYHCKIQLVIKTGSKPVKPSGSVNLIKKLELELFKTTFLEKEMATHSSVLAWRIPVGSLVGCRQWGRTESDTTEAT